jgi:hypothetical protein
MNYIRDGLLVKPIVVQVPSRVSLAGNPSDLIGQAEDRAKRQGRSDLHIPADGAVISMPVWSLSASVTLLSSTIVEIIAPRSKFKNWAEYVSAVKERGIGDWEHIIDKTVDVLGDMLDEAGIPPSDAVWSIHLDTNIPRQRGVSGSSGMILAFMQATLIAHGIEDHFTVVEKAVKVLSVETALGVSAGLQDRILQSVALSDPEVGAVFMDFSRNVRGQSCKFVPIDTELPEMALVLSDQPSHSGEIHEPIIERLIAGDKRLEKQFQHLGNQAKVARSYIQEAQWDSLGAAMTNTAEGRIEIYGEEALGPVNMALVEACRAAKCPFNFTGSGGAVVVLLPEGDESYLRLSQEVASSGTFTIYRL